MLKRLFSLVLLGVATLIAQTNFRATSPYIWWFGNIIVGNNGHNYWALRANQHRLEFQATDTGAAMTCDAQLFGALTYTYTVDGGAEQTLSVGAGWSWNTVLSAVLDGLPHKVQIYVKTGSPPTSYFDSDASLRCTNGTLSAPTGYGTFAPVDQRTATPNPYIALSGAPTYDSTGGSYNGYPAFYFGTGEGGFRFRAAVTDLWVWDNTTKQKYRVYQDDTLIATTGIYSSPFGNWDIRHVATGLSGTHDYEIVNIGDGASGGSGQVYLYGIMFGGGTGPVAIVPTRRPAVAWCGDSIVTQEGVSLTDMTTGTAWLATRPLGFAPKRNGTSGAKVSTALRDSCPAAAAGSGVPTAMRAEVIILQGGANDVAQGVTIGNPSTPGTLAGDYYTMILNTATNARNTGGSVATIVAEAILPNTYTNYANRDAYNAGIKAAVDAYNATAPTVKARYVNTDGWIVPATDTADTLHPNAAGQAKVAARWQPILQALVYGCGKAAGFARGCNGVQ